MPIEASQTISNSGEDSYNYDDYAWADEDLETIDTAVIFDLEPQVRVQPTSPPAKNWQATEVASPQLSTKPSSDNSEPATDPLASLHAALGIGSSGQVSKQAVIDEVRFTDKSIQDELEETSKTPQEPLPDDIIDDGSDTEEDKQELQDKVEAERIMAESVALVEPPTVAPLEKRAAALNEVAIVGQDKTNSNGNLYKGLDLSDESDEWTKLVMALDLPGTFHQIAQSSTMERLSDQSIAIRVSPNQSVICTDSAKAGIELALIKSFDKTLSVEWSFEEPRQETPGMIFSRKTKEKHKKACDSLTQHPFSQQIMNKFNAQLITESIEYL